MRLISQAVLRRVLFLFGKLTLRKFLSLYEISHGPRRTTNTMCSSLVSHIISPPHALAESVDTSIVLILFILPVSTTFFPDRRLLLPGQRNPTKTTAKTRARRRQSFGCATAQVLNTTLINDQAANWSGPTNGAVVELPSSTKEE